MYSLPYINKRIKIYDMSWACRTNEIKKFVQTFDQIPERKSPHTTRT